MEFLLGTHQPNWLWQTDVPLFASYARLRKRKRPFKPATAPYAVDSSGYSQLQSYGYWTFTAKQYVDGLRRCNEELGPMKWAAPMDWMCERAVIDGGWVGGIKFAGTHLPVPEHQVRTVDNYLELRALAPELNIIPVVQGERNTDYERHADMYERRGVRLAGEPLVGVGSVCRLQGTKRAESLVSALTERGFRLHMFGVKTLGLRLYGHKIRSSDSMSWSAKARRSNERLPGCTTHGNCANCLPYALSDRAEMLRDLDARWAAGIPGELPVVTFDVLRHAPHIEDGAPVWRPGRHQEPPVKPLPAAGPVQAALFAERATHDERNDAA